MTICSIFKIMMTYMEAGLGYSNRNMETNIGLDQYGNVMFRIYKNTTLLNVSPSLCLMILYYFIAQRQTSSSLIPGDDEFCTMYLLLTVINRFY